jgi:prepilin-type N-terminal cleavage/methylation domain-containing protein
MVMGKKSNNQGFTLVEIMMVCILLAGVIVSFFYMIQVGFALVEKLSTSVIALNDAGSIIENMRNIDPLSVANLTTAYPDGASIAGFAHLNNEAVTVNYEDLSADPIKVYVRVTWQGSRMFTEELVTLLTKR